ncbi:MAG: hypothetical protein ACJ8AW_51610, partial [Rhodopila sp.]
HDPFLPRESKERIDSALYGFVTTLFTRLPCILTFFCCIAPRSVLEAAPSLPEATASRPAMPGFHPGNGPIQAMGRDKP